MNEDRAGPRDTLRFNQLLSAAKLTGGDVVLNRGDDHWDYHPRLGDAGRLRYHPFFQDLSFDLPKPRLQ